MIDNHTLTGSGKKVERSETPAKRKIQGVQSSQSGDVGKTGMAWKQATLGSCT